MPEIHATSVSTPQPNSSTRQKPLRPDEDNAQDFSQILTGMTTAPVGAKELADKATSGDPTPPAAQEDETDTPITTAEPATTLAASGVPLRLAPAAETHTRPDTTAVPSTITNATAPATQQDSAPASLFFQAKTAQKTSAAGPQDTPGMDAAPLHPGLGTLANRSAPNGQETQLHGIASHGPSQDQEMLGTPAIVMPGKSPIQWASAQLHKAQTRDGAPPSVTNQSSESTSHIRGNSPMSALGAADAPLTNGSPFAPVILDKSEESTMAGAALNPTQATVLTSPFRSEPAHPVSLAIRAGLHDPSWGTEVAKSLIVMSRDDMQRAELILSPPDIGRIEITLDVKGDQASAYFVSASPEVRTMLENSLPQLKDRLQEAGLTLSGAFVHSDNPSNKQDSPPRPTRQNPFRMITGGAIGIEGTGPKAGPRAGAIDTYA